MGVKGLNQQNTHILILNKKELKGKEFAFMSKWLKRKFSHCRMMLTSEKHSGT